ncbi:RnfABCDGE type electron transport complex subunit D [Mahella australiensis]|uniref:Ion-translocating oxidoreductase complex subunit D n=1 Tax=Mahella australiensis (strain DSM 15567 / CIP 107919 / 50-1 BON) TaxID=697281 RepID=F3ZVI9_MAHA5|nr:RnfABCDGE type electron transport complex subunit D [Mahella australiensis]AEE96351.1 electron transport complex, RnfABCDGE type, D subunit [Mahella australiensis 50-1 BON]
MENEQLVVSSSPHVRSESSVSGIMLDVVIALVPTIIAAAIFFGMRALFIIGISIATAVLTEALIQYLMKKPVTINDWSAVVTGLLLAFNLPPTAPWWLAVIGSAFAIAIVKQLFGGLSYNFLNPALAARAFLLASWPVRMTAWVQPGVDAVTTATPLAILKGTEAAGQLPSLMDMFVGNIGGTIGETSALALLIGAAYLLYKRVINWRIPFVYMATVGVLTWILGPDGAFTGQPLYHVLGGGLILGAFFMATDYVTSPVTPLGQIIMGLGCGIITVVIRLYGGYPEGVSYSILFMNVATPLIERYTVPKKFGEVKGRA